MIEICDLMRKDLAQYSEIKEYKVLAGGSSGGAGGETTVDVEIYGFDFEKTDIVAAELASPPRNPERLFAGEHQS